MNQPKHNKWDNRHYFNMTPTDDNELGRKADRIATIKAAVDMGLTVTLADSSAYSVIKDSIGQYLISYMDGENYIGLHGREGTKYEHEINHRGEWIVSGSL